MPLVQIPVGIAPCQVDDFPEKVGKGEDARLFERSCKGSLRLRPASTKTLTKDELNWLKEKKQWAHVGRRIHVVDVEIVTDSSARSLTKPKKGGPVEKAQAEAAAEKAAQAKQPPKAAEDKAKPKPVAIAPTASKPPEDSTSSGKESSNGRSRRGRGSE